MAANRRDSSDPNVSNSKIFLAWLTVTVVLMAIFQANAWAWGRIGHRVAATLAEEHLTPRARVGIHALLGNGIRLADIATWADEQQEVSGTGLWHSVNVPVRESRYDSRYCLPGGCVVSKIEEFKRVLMSPSTGKAEKQRALKFLVHFVADLHQPLHVGDNNDRGGNLLQVRFFGEGSNLHRVWDYQIMERHTENEKVWMWDLTFQANPKKVAEWSRGSPEEWATESLILAKSARRLPGSQSWIKPGASIAPEYCSAALPTIQRQLAKAGIRTAWMLNQIFQ
jgi:nuclease S1